MKIKNLVCNTGLFVILALSACKTTAVDQITPEPPAPVKTLYLIKETFEYGVKAAYALDSVQLITGKWAFSDALLGSLPADPKNESKSVRLRTGFLAMNFDITGMSTLYISHAKYGNDANSTWQLLASTDGGKNYTQLGSDII